jgi:hypothetical protein
MILDKDLGKTCNVLMNCPTLEKTLVPLPLCELDTKEKLMVLKGRCKEMTRGARSRS